MGVTLKCLFLAYLYGALAVMAWIALREVYKLIKIYLEEIGL